MLAVETQKNYGALLRSQDFVFKKEKNGVERSEVVGDDVGAQKVSLSVLRLPLGHRWQDRALEDRVVVIFSGSGTASLQGKESQQLVQGSVIYAPANDTLQIDVSEAAGMTVYQWAAKVPEEAVLSQSPRLFSNLWDAETQLEGFGGVSGETPKFSAIMNFLFWPGVGTPHLSLHCGIQESGQTFNVHTHEESEEAFIVFEGNGQMFLGETWHDVSPGDVLFAPPGVPHGARNPDRSPTARRFVTCGGPTPFDPQLYKAAGVTSEVS